MYNSQYYTCEQIDQRLLQGYLDDYNTQNNTNLTKAELLTQLATIIGKNATIDNLVAQIGYYICETAAATAAKTLAAANYELLAGGSLKVKFINKNTANNATLNINGKGAKALYYQGERVSSTNTWEANEVVEIFYDGTDYYANNVKGESRDGVKLANGTYNNPSNTYAVRTEFIETKGVKVVGIETDRPNASGCVYRYAYCLTSSYNDIGTTRYSTQMEGKIIALDIAFTDSFKPNGYDISNYPSAVGVGFVIAEYNESTGTANPLRITDFDGYYIKILTSPSINGVIQKFIEPTNEKVSTITETLKPVFRSWKTQSAAKLINIIKGLDLKVTLTNNSGALTSIRCQLRKADGTNVYTSNFQNIPNGGVYTEYLYTQNCEDNTYLYITSTPIITSDVTIEYVNEQILWQLNNGQIYFNDIAFDFDSTNVYLKFTNCRRRVIGYGDYTISAVATSAGVELVTSPNGLTNCLQIGTSKSLVYNIRTKSFAIKDRGTEELHDIILLSQVDGMVINACRSLIGYLVKTSYNHDVHFTENDNLLGIRLFSSDMKQGNIANNATDVTASTKQIYKDYTAINPNICKVLRFLGTGVGVYKLRLNFYNSSKQAIYGSGVYNYINNIAVPSNAAYFRLGFSVDGETPISPSAIDAIEFYIKYENLSEYTNRHVEEEIAKLPTNEFKSLFAVSIPDWRYQGAQQKIFILKGINVKVRFQNVLSSSSDFAARLRDSSGNTIIDSNWKTVSANGYFEHVFETDYIDEDAYLYITCATNNTAKTTVEISYKDGIYSLSQHGNESENLINQIGRDPRTGQTLTGNTLVLAHFSDIHGSKKNLQYIVDFCSKYSTKIDDILQTGDLQKDYWNSGISFFTSTSGAEKILNVIGNHDAWAGSSYGPELESKVNVYNRFIAPFISNWGTIVQPTDAATNGLNYYYKDYSSEKIRLIVLDCMYWDSAENTWLQSVLSDARTNGLSVICSSHYTPGALTHFDCSFDDSIWSALEQPYLNAEAAASVQSFIDNGGEFITWLCGHTHKDYLGTLSNYQNQLVIIIDTASNGAQANSGIINRVVATQSEYLFNILGFDTVNKVIRLFRVGANRDCFMRTKDTLCIKYTTKQLIK